MPGMGHQPEEAPRDSGRPAPRKLLFNLRAGLRPRGIGNVAEPCRKWRPPEEALRGSPSRGPLLRALRDLALGRPVLVYDAPSRESEVDMVYYAGLVGVGEVHTLRSVAGGLICYATSREVGGLLGLRYMHELLGAHGYSQLLKRPRYGDPSPFSLYVNHIGVRTGISDADRALTIRELHKVVELAVEGRIEEARTKFYSEFYAPGHVPVLLARGLGERRGHTELAVALAIMAGLKPSVVFAEMLGYGSSLDLRGAERVAQERNLVLLSGDEIAEAWAELCG